MSSEKSPSTLFVFDRYQIQGNTILFFYKIILPESEEYVFVERLEFEKKILLNKKPVPTVLLENLHLMLGISYYKLFCPRTIEISTFSITKRQAEFWNIVYTKGLGEFFYKNKIDFHGLVQFPYEAKEQGGGETFDMQKTNNAVLLPVGGGKDSIVSAELLKEKKQDFVCFTLNGNDLQTNVIKSIGRPNINVIRVLDEKLFNLVAEKRAYNGHIPVTAIYSFVALFVAFLYELSGVVMSNEKSANYGNVKYLDSEINHQWSKSEEFEHLFQAYIAANITRSITYSSQLREFSELDIVKKFSSYDNYFQLFSSCNRNFTLQKKYNGPKWCGKCPKCAFVFVMLAAFVPKKTLMSIFGKNLFADSTLIPIYRELLGITEVKPFECVGTPEETKQAFDIVLKKGEYADDVVVKELPL